MTSSKILLPKVYAILEKEELGLSPKEVQARLYLHWREYLFLPAVEKKKTLDTIRRLLRNHNAFELLPNDKYGVNQDENRSIDPAIKTHLNKSISIPKARKIEDTYQMLKDADGPVNIAEIVNWSGISRIVLLKYLNQHPNIERISSNLYQAI